MANDDPFGAFGSDSDDDSSNDNEGEVGVKQDLSRIVALSLVKQANDKGGAAVPDKPTPVKGRPKPTGATVDLSNLQPLDHSWMPPLYLSPHIQLVSSLPYGGGRGYVALQELGPGTLVLVEHAIMEWPDDQLGQALTLASVQHILMHPHATQIVHDIEDFHPTKIVVDNISAAGGSDGHGGGGADPDQVEHMMAFLQSQHSSDTDPLLRQLQQIANERNITNRNGSALGGTDLFRLLLALRYNGLESGVYCHVAMLNHSCLPNCVKFLPGNDGDPSSSGDIPESNKYSEVRTTRTIAPGESLTISYMPTLVSHASRRRHLWDQHRFDVGVNLTGPLQYMELIRGGLPSSSKDRVDDDSITSRAEHTIAELEALSLSIQQELNGSGDAQLWEQAKALEVSSLELVTQARQQLQNDKHILLIPCLKLHVDACDTVLRQDSTTTTISPRSLLTNAQRCKLLGRQVASTRELIALHQFLGGNDHFDLARTYLDLAQAIEELLSKSPKTLYELEQHNAHLTTTWQADNKSLTTFSAWSQLEHTSRKEHERIRAFYPRDAAKHIGQNVDNTS